MPALNAAESMASVSKKVTSIRSIGRPAGSTVGTGDAAGAEGRLLAAADEPGRVEPAVAAEAVAKGAAEPAGPAEVSGDGANAPAVAPAVALAAADAPGDGEPAEPAAPGTGTSTACVSSSCASA